MTRIATEPDIPALQATTFDLWGSRLIEASAGTGKTWTIAALYLRLVLGHGGEHAFARPLRPAEILVMTFTRAATRELSDRIRQRLLEAAQCFRGERQPHTEDSFLTGLMADYAKGPLRQHAAWVLASAAESMDDASVHTIDAWCQRMLKEHAFDSGNLFEEELVADEHALRLQASQDYWRQACYPLAQAPLKQVLAIWGDVAQLDADVRGLLSQDIAPAAGAGTLAEVLTQTMAQRAGVLAQLKQGWALRAQTMQDWLDGQTASKGNGWDGRRLSPRHYTGWLATLRQWAEDAQQDAAPDLKTGWDRFTPDGLLGARKPDAPPIALPPEFAAFATLKADIGKLPEISVALRLHAAVNVGQRLHQLKRQRGSFGFADMLHRLDTALGAHNGARLRQRILAQYPVILIDEFQDTSPLQYQIFDRLYQTQANDRHSALLLIGDPKQSIYGFRGADIHSYLRARRATQARHSVLQTNFRSTQAVVEAVNHWFARADCARSEGAFMYRQGPDNPLPFIQVRAHGRAEQLHTAQGVLPAMTLVHDLEPVNNDEMRRRFAARCAEQIACWLNDRQAGFRTPGASGQADDFKPLRPADIAILVRTGTEATAVRRELARRNIPSVYLSDKDSVFASTEAHDLVHWLRAVAAPHDARLVRAALATASMGLSLAELTWLASNDEAFDVRAESLRQLRSVWQMQGVLAMLRQTLHQDGLAARWLAGADGERRLTNFLHLAELLQSASSSQDGEQSLIRWLLTQIAQGPAQGDEQVLRLESDADLVKVVTIHKSKGLEYPLVCLPFASSFRARDRKSTSFVTLADDAGERTLHLQFGDDELAQAERDRLREDVRLLYVALTRARHALWLGFSAVKVGQSDASVSHKSAAGYLLGGSEGLDRAGWLALLEQLGDGCADIHLQPAHPHTPCTHLQRAMTEATLLPAPLYQADFDRHWTVGSFSGLTRGLDAAPPVTALSPLQTPRPADDEPEPLLPAPASVQTLHSAPAGALADPAPWHRFARGAQAGNFLHEQLEWLAAEGFALAGNDPLAARLQQRCARAGYGDAATELAHWLTTVLQTRLPGPQAALTELTQVLPEMEFWLPADCIDSSQVDALCQQHLLPGVPRPALVPRQLHGMLMGFADLVFEHQGRFWVLDYKSNHLGDQDDAYQPEALAHAMAEHRYDVQAALYLLALHRLLRQRLGSAYQPGQHLGGAVYLFLRGIQGPASGVCLIAAKLPLLDALDAMLAPAALPV